MWVDAHCHMELSTVDAQLIDAQASGVGLIVNMGTDGTDWASYRELAQRYRCCKYGIGLHPGAIPENWRAHVDAMATYLKSACPPAVIGEIGLDFSPTTDDVAKASQKEVFARQLAVAVKYDLPVSVHARGAQIECLEMLLQSKIKPNKVIFHCFAGGVEEAEALVHYGAYVGFSGIVTFKNATSVREAIKVVPHNRILIETDAPWLSPHPYRGQPNTPARVAIVGECCAHTLDMPVEAFKRLQWENATHVFGSIA